MKITEETRIKDLIPEGMELDLNKMESVKRSENIDIITKPDLLILPLKEKVKKDFEWYVNEYKRKLNGNDFFNTRGNSSLSFKTFMQHQYNHMPFEFKIGLLKFICDDLDRDIQSVLSVIPTHIKDISNIISKEFLESIFK